MSSPSLNMFEILITDGLNKSEITTVQSLSNALAYSEKLWKSPKINGESQNAIIEDQVLGIRLKSDKVKNDSTSFLISIEYQNTKEIEAFKKNLYQHITGKLEFSSIKVVADSLSEQVSSEIQPYILSAEKAVKRAILESALLNNGIDTLNLPKAVAEKISNKKSFSGFTKNIDVLDFLLVDFDDISLLINNDVVLKKQIGQKWGQLALLRDQAVTNVLLTVDDLNQAKTISTELIELVTSKSLKPSAVISKTENVIVEKKPEPVKEVAAEVEKKATVLDTPIVKEKETITLNQVEEKVITAPVVEKQNIVEKEVVIDKPKVASTQNTGNLMITEIIFLEELKKIEREQAGKNINLKTFVSETLAGLGYTTGPAYFASRSLAESGKLEVFDTKDETGLIFKALKSV